MTVVYSYTPASASQVASFFDVGISSGDAHKPADMNPHSIFIAVLQIQVRGSSSGVQPDRLVCDIILFPRVWGDSHTETKYFEPILMLDIFDLT